MGRFADLSGKVAIVTGGAVGIGGAIGSALAENGVSVAVVDNDPFLCSPSVTFYLRQFGAIISLDKQKTPAYTSANRKQCLIKSNQTKIFNPTGMYLKGD